MAGLLRRIYTWILCGTLPFLGLRLILRGIRQPNYRCDLRERFGYGLAGESGSIWIHAVSVGEVAATIPLLRRLRAIRSEPFLVTTTTPTGREQARHHLGDAVSLCYAPLDLPHCVRLLLDRVRPRLLILIETELWPNLIEECHRRAIPVVLINGRLSAASAGRYALLKPLAKTMLRQLTWVAAQTEPDARRFQDLGVQSDHLHVTGSLKFDVVVPDQSIDQARTHRIALAGTRPIWIAASTGIGEEQQVLDAFGIVRGALPEALLVLVPRHPHRAAEIGRLCERSGFVVQRHALGSTTTATVNAATNAEVYLLDTVGELMAFYAISDVAFVGGSMNGAGGHNVLEPAALGVPVLVGPDTHNFDEITRLLVDAGGAQRVLDAQELGVAVTRMLCDGERRSRVGAAARTFFESHGGATRQVTELIVQLLAKGPASMTDP